jgi:cobalt-precorrin 5A hydrolase
MTNLSVTSSETPIKTDSGSGIAIFALTRKGAELAGRLREQLAGSACFCNFRHALPGMTGFLKISDELTSAWHNYRSIICIMSCGIVVRTIAPLLRKKTCDPAVVVLDEDGRFAISLVSGHLGGANELARKAAALTGGQAVITTASDLRGKPAIDLIAQKAGLIIENPAMLSTIASAVLDEEPLWIFDPKGILTRHLPADHGLEILPATWSVDRETMGRDGEQPDSGKPGGDGEHLRTENAPGIWVSEFVAPAGMECLLLRPSTLVIGIGCNRGTMSAEITGFIEKVLGESCLSALSIRNFTSIDLKADERGLLDAAEAFERPIFFCTREEIVGITVPNPSEMVARHIGAESVCEASALWSAKSGNLLVPKRKSGNCTLAIALADSL